MAFYSDVFRFRGEGAIVPWDHIRQNQDKQARNSIDPQQNAQRIEATQNRFADVQLRWMVAPTLGMPSRPFHVFRRRRAGFPVKTVPLARSAAVVTFERVAAVVDVEVHASPGARVLLSASRISAREGDDGRVINVSEILAADARTMPASGITFMRIRCSGATVVQVSSGSIVRAEVAWLEDVLNLQDWKETEIVGLPFEVGSYVAMEQGMVDALTDPASAALERLRRGSPPIGWFPATETGIMAPDWFAPDPLMLIAELSNALAPEIKPLFDGRPAHEAAMDKLVRQVTPAGSTLKAEATLRPFDMLTLPSSAEAPLALTLGFGTAYTGDEGDLQVEESADYMVVATFDHEIPGSRGLNEIAAFIPSPAPHLQLTAPQLLDTRNVGFTAPDDRDKAWQADVQAIWALVLPSAALERPSGSGFARTDSGALKAESLLPKRDAGGPRPLLPATTTDASMPPVGNNPSRVPGDRYALVNGDLEIPTLAGVRSMIHSVALVDLYGVWSPWEDRGITISAPIPPRPAIVDLGMAALFAGLPGSCPTTTTIDVVLDWETRTPSTLHLTPILFPTNRNGNSPGAPPPTPVTAPARAIPMTLPFDGDELKPPTIIPSGFAVDVDHVDEEGKSSVIAGSDQGKRRRRYRVRLMHTLDYSSSRWWGVEVWARTDLAAGLASAWVPIVPDGTDPADFHEHAMSAKAASPVPPTPPLIAQGPDVPLGSTQDSNGCSHTRIPIDFYVTSARKVSVWEVSEAALRTAGGLSQRADDTQTPSERLVQARNVYDGLPPTRRRSVFRRMLTVDAGTLFLDVPLPRGSTDIHFFALTAITAEGVESAWPQGGSETAPHEYLHTVIGPRLVSPAPPELRVSTTATGHEFLMKCLSRIPVSRFELFATHSSAAARNARTMGLPVASPVAMLDATWAADPDIPAEQGMRCYKATVTSTLERGWNPWFLRAVAVPVDAIGQLGVRGMRSPDAPTLPFDPRPVTGPTLEPVSGRSLATPIVAFNTATDAITRETAAGMFQIRVQVESASTAQTTMVVRLADIPEVANPLVRPATIPDFSHPPLVVRGPRAGERVAIGVWWQRPDPDDPVSARITITDPLGRNTHATGTAPSIRVDPTFPIRIVGDPKIVSNNVTIEMTTKAPRDPDWVLEIVVIPRSDQSIIRPRPVKWTLPLSQIKGSKIPITRETIQVRYEQARLPDPLRREKGKYVVFVRLSPPFSFVVRLVDPRNQASTATIEVKARRRLSFDLPPRRLP